MAEPYLGEIRMFGGSYAPQGWAFCNGQLISISESDALFSLIGTTYGGDGLSTFALPDLQGRIPLGQGANYTLGQKGGVETVTLAVQNMPVHSHVPHVNSQNGNSEVPTNAFWAQSTLGQYSIQAPNSMMMNGLLSVVGGNQPHNNMMPSLGISFIIALQGIWPSPE